jgi:regulator of replication initiation timing
METATYKKDIIDWISQLEDQKILMEIASIKRNATFNFEEEFKKGITSDELKKRLSERIKTLPWKK